MTRSDASGTLAPDIVVCHHNESSASAVVASLRVAYLNQDADVLPPKFLAADSPTLQASVRAIAAQHQRPVRVLFNGAMCLASPRARSLLASLPHQDEAEVAMLWHETGVGLRLLAGWPQSMITERSAFGDWRRRLSFSRLRRVAAAPGIRHLTVSRASQAAVATFFDVDPYRIAVVRNCLPLSDIPVARPRQAAYLSFAGAGVSQRRKRLDVFAWLASEFRSDGTDWCWYGEVPSEHRRPGVAFPGFVRPLWSALGKHDAFVMPSVDEPMSIAGLEALAVGRPVFCLAGTGLAELVDADYVATSFDDLRDRIARFVRGELRTDAASLRDIAETHCSPAAWRRAVSDAWRRASPALSEDPST